MKIFTYGSPVLKSISSDVTVFDADISNFMKDLALAMKKANGAGLAAPQVGKSVRAFVIIDDAGSLYKVVNPKVVGSKGRISLQEGCLSLPGLFFPVERAKEIDVEYQDDAGRIVNQKFSGLASRAYLHELDHLDGKLLTDFMSQDQLRWYLTRNMTAASGL